MRDTAFLGGPEIVCGVEVAPLSLRRLIALEQAHNGFVVPWQFESMQELLAHSIQAVYFCTANPMLPGIRYSFWDAFKMGRHHHNLAVGMLKRHTPDAIVKEVSEWIADAFMDAPSGGGNDSVRSPTYASYPAYVVDKFAEAGLPFSYDEIMDMPLRRLWQHWRIAAKRISDAPLTNPSDDLAARFIAGGAN